MCVKILQKLPKRKTEILMVDAKKGTSPDILNGKKSGLGSKLHAVCGGHWRPVELLPTAGKCRGISSAPGNYSKIHQRRIICWQISVRRQLVSGRVKTPQDSTLYSVHMQSQSSMALRRGLV
ncbi:MAG: hypothetical protein LBB16_00870 [Puniceicoccales bacterium]|nr:hypothetical protein [Puniceicoccales bacterium]